MNRSSTEFCVKRGLTNGEGGEKGFPLRPVLHSDEVTYTSMCGIGECVLCSYVTVCCSYFDDLFSSTEFLSTFEENKVQELVSVFSV